MRQCYNSYTWNISVETRKFRCDRPINDIMMLVDLVEITEHEKNYAQKPRTGIQIQ